MKVLVVGGTFDNTGGKPSELLSKLISKLSDIVCIGDDYEFQPYNGGDMYLLQAILDRQVSRFDVVIWFPNFTQDLCQKEGKR